jgi:hypothetical protein
VQTDLKEQPELKEQRSVRKRISGLPTVVTVIGALITAAGGAIGIWKALDQPGPAKTSGEVTITAAIHPTTLADFFQRIGKPLPSGVPRSQKGTLVMYRVRTTGYRGKKLSLGWTVETGDRTRELDRGTFVDITPESDDDTSEVVPQFVPDHPQLKSPFRVSIVLSDPHGTRLHSDTMRVKR